MISLLVYPSTFLTDGLVLTQRFPTVEDADGLLYLELRFDYSKVGQCVKAILRSYLFEVEEVDEKYRSEKAQGSQNNPDSKPGDIVSCAPGYFVSQRDHGHYKPKH